MFRALTGSATIGGDMTQETDMQTQVLKLVRVGSAHDLTRLEIEGKYVEAAGLRTDFPM